MYKRQLMIITCIAILIQASFMIKSMTPQLIIFNVAVMAAGFIWAFYRTGSGKAKPVSYTHLHQFVVRPMLNIGV